MSIDLEKKTLVNDKPGIISGKGLVIAGVIWLVSILAALFIGGKMNRADYPETEYHVYPASYSADIYSKPGEEAKIVGTLETGSLPYVGTDYSYDWYEVIYNGRHSYIRCNEAIIVKGNLNDTTTVYYVSIGGGRTYEEAMKRVEELSGKDLEAPVFESMDHDESTGGMIEVFRICPKAFYSKDAANECARSYQSRGIMDAFTWKSVGQAKCVFQPSKLSSEPFIVFPE